MLAFWSIVVAAWLILLAVLLVPMLRGEATARSHWLMQTLSRRIATSALISALVVASSAALYLHWSSGYSVIAQSTEHEVEIDRLVAQLAARLEAAPDNPDGWLLLASSYQTLEQYDRAARAYAEAASRIPLEAWAQVNYAETLFARDGSFSTRAKELLAAALAAEPDSVRALFLIGLAELEQKNYAAVIAHWEHLVALSQSDPQTLAAVQSKIDEIRELAAQEGVDIEEAGDASASPRDSKEEETTAGDAPARTDNSEEEKVTSGDAPARPDNSEEEKTTADSLPARTRDGAQGEAEAASEGACSMRVRVRLADELASQAAASDTLFVYAKAASGPPMPLAIKRFQASDLPVETCLGSADAMIKTMTLEHFETVVIVARISQSGLARAQAGDLQGQSAPIATKQEQERVIQILIDEQVP